jgi:GNAT superfamily N-acetyltransferase
MIPIVQATQSHLDQVLPLFDQYRIFYNQQSDREGAGKFLLDRLLNDESVLFLALDEGRGIGFTQLFKSFSSVSMQPVFILNDLFVAKSHRNKGVGAALLRKAQQYCRDKQYKGLALETAVDNPAQLLYERMGWEKESHCFHYFWKAP